MVIRFFLFFLLVGIHLSPAQARIKRADIRFVFVDKKVKGTISGFNSSSTLDLENLSNSRFSGSVAVETLKTGNFLRDWSLKSRKYFNADDYPKIAFQSNAVSPTEEGFNVEGTLTIKGKDNPMTFYFTQNNKVLLGKGILFSSDFDIFIKKERTDNKVEVQLEFLLE